MQELIWDGGRNRNFSFSFVFEKYLPFKENALRFQIFFFFKAQHLSIQREIAKSRSCMDIFTVKLKCDIFYSIL